jgi:zinc D-Ala-D-Ala carboxypeptidase
MKAILTFALTLFLLAASASAHSQKKDSLFAGLSEREYLTGKFEPTSLPDYFMLLPSECSAGEQRLRKEAAQAFIQMVASAQMEGIFLRAVSSTRSFFRQKGIWEAKWKGDRKVEGINLGKVKMSESAKAELIMRYSSMPGTSRHHWGTDLDINSVDDDYFKSAEGQRVYSWLQANAGKFGFCQVYHSKQKSGRSGYEEEKWHWSYLPLAVPLTQKYKTLLSDEDISGFLGSETAPKIQVVTKYVLGLNLDCMSNP